MDVIWRGTYYARRPQRKRVRPLRPRAHPPAFGGGYPSGGEEYLSEN